MNSTGQAVAIGHVLSASGSSAYASTWTNTSPQTSATMTVAFGGSGGGSPTISTSSPLPGGTVGTPYSDQLAATGGGGAPYTWSVSSGSPAAGLSLQGGGGSGGCRVHLCGAAGRARSPRPPRPGSPRRRRSCRTSAARRCSTPRAESGIYTGFLGGSVNGGPSTTVGAGSRAAWKARSPLRLPGHVRWPRSPGASLMSQAAISNYVNSIPDVDANGNQMSGRVQLPVDPSRRTPTRTVWRAASSSWRTGSPTRR